ncbi:MAG: DUF5011 domain-containing protein [Turicibacter sp.]|nr:DUF5011 domain-containing protein [Turicibacter sp.]
MNRKKIKTVFTYGLTTMMTLGSTCFSIVALANDASLTPEAPMFLNETDRGQAIFANSKPDFIVDDSILLIVGDEFNPLDYVLVHDDEDGYIDLEESHVIFNNVDTSKAGLYQVTYQVADKEGAVSTKTVPVRINAIPVIHAQDVTLKVGDSFNPLDYITVTDDEEIKLTASNVVSNNVDTSKVGVYQVTYRVEDSYWTSTTKTIQVHVIENSVNSTNNQINNNKELESTPANDQPTVKKEPTPTPTPNNNQSTVTKEGNLDSSTSHSQSSEEKSQKSESAESLINELANDESTVEEDEIKEEDSNHSQLDSVITAPDEINQQLPKTGFSSTFNLFLGGLITLTGGSLIILSRKNKL